MVSAHAEAGPEQRNIKDIIIIIIVSFWQVTSTISIISFRGKNAPLIKAIGNGELVHEFIQR